MLSIVFPVGFFPPSSGWGLIQKAKSRSVGVKMQICFTSSLVFVEIRFPNNF